MLIWSDDQLQTLDLAVRRATDGLPTVLEISGEPGTGKSAFLGALRDRATAFHTLAAAGIEGVDLPFGVLQQWGVDVPGLDDKRPTSPFIVAQSLRAHLDAGRARRPGLLLIDDLQWADPDSVAALVWLLRRATGDQLLLAVGTRASKPGTFPTWESWTATNQTVLRQHLRGLTRVDTATLIATEGHQLDQRTVDKLWQHTSGNPLYLRALLAEHPDAELQHSLTLPAPTQYATLMQAQLARLPTSTIALVEAAAVLGSSWCPLPLLAEVSGVDDPSEATQAAVQALVIDVRPIDGILSARFVHDLARAAVYDHIPLERRRLLHQRSATALSEPALILEHRVAAADRWDDALATDLVEAATRMHETYSHRLSAQYLQWSGLLSSDAQIRKDRTADAAFDLAQAGEPASPPAVGLGDPHRSRRWAVAEGAYAVVTGRWEDGVRLLGPAIEIAAGRPAPSEALAHYRAATMLAWAQVGCGAGSDAILRSLQHAATSGAKDPTLISYEVFARGIALARQSTPVDLLGTLGELPANPRQFSYDQTFALAWRGQVRIVLGKLADAIADFQEAQRRLSGDLTGLVDSAFHGVIGFGHWLMGDWGRAQVSFRLAADVAERFVLPIILTYLPLQAAATGDFAEADRQIQAVSMMLAQRPWQEAVQTLLILRTVRAHAGGDPAEQAALLSQLRAQWPEQLQHSGLVGPIYLMHAALASIWAGEVDTAQNLIARLDQAAEVVGWARSAAAWLSGLLVERDHPDEAIRLLREASTSEFTLPLYRAHAWSDRARLARHLGHLEEAERSAAAAQSLYAGLGAVPFTNSKNLSIQPASPHPATRPLGDLQLTSREEDVIALIGAGMSYAQIGRELFITQSTVSYHLSNIYAKTGVRSRHELSGLLRG